MAVDGRGFRGMVTLPACIQQTDSANSKHTITMNEATKPVPLAQREIKLTPADESRFWAKVNKDGPTMPHMDTPCWVWTATKVRTGYGQIKVGGKMILSHRVAWTIENGPIPPGLCIIHQCDNPSCARASHLHIGTHQDNMDDMAAKGRRVVARGEDQGRATLTSSNVIEIRAKYAAGGTTLKGLAAQFGVSFGLIGHIINRRLWKHIP